MLLTDGLSCIAHDTLDQRCQLRSDDIGIWTDIDPNGLRRLYAECRLSAAEIGERYGCGKQTVLNTLARYEIPRRRGRRPKLTNTDIQELMRLYVDRGWTQRSLAKKFNVGINTIHRYIHSNLSNYRSGSLPEEGPARTVLTDECVEGLRLMYTDWRWSVEFIADHYRCSTNDVLDALKRFGIATEDGPGPTRHIERCDTLATSEQVTQRAS